MASTINNSATGITTTGDASGILAIQTNGVTAQTLGADQSTTFGGTVNLAAGTTTVPPIDFTAGTNLTTQRAGAVEYDGANFYGTVDTSTGRGSIPVLNQFKLLAAGTGITATAAGTNFFGNTSNIPLVASAFYEIEIVMFWTLTTTNIRNYSLAFNSAPTAYDVYYEMSPATGLVAPPGSTAMLIGQAYNQTGATYTVTTASLSGTNHYARFRIPYLRCAAGTTVLSIEAYTGTSGTITPGIGSFWTARRLPATNIGTYAA